MTETTELRRLARFISELQWDKVPDSVKRATQNVMLDTVGVALGGSKSDLVHHVIRQFEIFDGSDRSVSLWGQGTKMSLQTAVLINTIQGHMLELDDAHKMSKTHIGDVVIPAAWALAEYCKCSGQELLLAVLCGYEVLSRIGMALGVSSHRNLGWHATATAGIFGAAAACGKILNLTEDEMVSAFGMAGQESGGSWAFLRDGASCKALNPAMAAVNGLQCAMLAKAGMTGPEHVLTAEDGGMLAMMSHNYDVSMAAHALGVEWEILNMDFKPYPCCRSTHCVIDGVLDLREKYDIRPEQVEKIDVYTYLVANKQCGMSPGSIRPRIPVEAKFSTPYTAAVALLYGAVGLQHFEPSAIQRQEIQELLDRVKVFTDDEFTSKYPKHWGCRVLIYDKTGAVYETSVTDPTGSADNPLTEKQLIQKISGLLRAVMTEEQAEQTMKQLWELESLPQVTSPCPFGY